MLTVGEECEGLSIDPEPPPAHEVLGDPEYKYYYFSVQTGSCNKETAWDSADSIERGWGKQNMGCWYVQVLLSIQALNTHSGSP